jgi:sugar phosphate isomerase/epimerase
MSATTPPPPSVQLWTVREDLARDPRGTLERIAAIGLTAVEPFGLVDRAEELSGILTDLGLAAPTAHTSLVDADLDAVRAAAARTGTTLVIEPFIPAERWATADDVARLADALNAAAATLAADGLTVGYHNHDWETRIEIDGEPALLALAAALDDRIVLEVDAYWAAVGGADPVALLERFGSRVAAIHVKDGPLDGDTFGQLPAGDGAVPLAAVLAAAPSARRVLEFDDYAGDVYAGLAASLTGLRRLEAAQ